mmetsp:Transcript_20646/g.63082  ORF Transcript_20646/g.63082 Transcript_20646/m.63082 type:complete len:454 (-) Transcript_20646:1793-3154(-)
MATRTALRGLQHSGAVLAACGLGAAVLTARQNSFCAAGEEKSGAEEQRSRRAERLAVGGVRSEYKRPPREIRWLEPPIGGFFHKEIVLRLSEEQRGIPIRAHRCVSDGALFVAADRLGRMLRYLPAPVLSRLERRGATLHIIGIDQGCSDLPEHAHMKGVDGGYTGEMGVTIDQRARGMGGTLSSCGEENLIDLDTDPRYAGRDILVHEFGHCVMDVGLPPSLHTEIGEVHRKAVVNGKWTREDGSRAYAGTCPAEYWAELTMWYFGSHGEFVDREKCFPPPGPGGLAQYDPDGFALLSSVYNGSHPKLKEEDPPATHLRPLMNANGDQQDVDAVSSDVDEAEAEASGDVVQLELDNAGCETDWELFWVDQDGKEVKYGVIPARSPSHMQLTFSGHVWLVRAADSAPCKLQELRYTAATGRCIAAVAKDAGCGIPAQKSEPPSHMTSAATRGG